MASDEPWAEDIEKVYESIHEITPHDERTFRDSQFSEERLREIFRDGFLAREDGGYWIKESDDTWIDENGHVRHRGGEVTDPDVFIDNKKELRDLYFEWLAFLGYDPDDFNWHDWREWMDYGRD